MPKDNPAVARKPTADDKDTARRLAAKEHELQRKAEFVRAFSFVVGHDLKEPIRAVELILHQLVEEHGDRLPPEGLALLQEARDENRRLQAFVQGLLEFSQAAHVDQTAREPLSVHEVLDGPACAPRLHPVLEETGGTLETPDPDVRVLGTPSLLAQILNNLILNGLQHNDAPHPIVRVRCARRGPSAEIIVEDNGPGFPRGVQGLPHGDGAPDPGGAFGLAIVRRAVQRLGGEASVGRSDALGGALVRVELAAA